MENEAINDIQQICLLPAGNYERILMRVRLEAESALGGAWYELSLVSTQIGYLITKQSGALGRGRGSQQTETWFRRNLPEAEKKYSRILADKVNPKRRSPRKYQIVHREVNIFNHVLN